MAVPRLDAITNFRFKVSIDGMEAAIFDEVSLPSLNMSPQTIEEGGQNKYTHKLATRVDVDTITLKHGLSDGLYLFNWYKATLDGDMKKAIKNSVSIVLYKVDRTPLMTVELRKAFPIKWSGPSFQAGGDQVAIDELEIAFHDFSLTAG